MRPEQAAIDLLSEPLPPTSDYKPMLILAIILAIAWILHYMRGRNGYWHRVRKAPGIKGPAMRRMNSLGKWEYRKKTDEEDWEDFLDRA